MTRIAFSIWNSRIAPVFEVARHMMVTEETDERSYAEAYCFDSNNTVERATILRSLGVTHLVCGAITTETSEILYELGIEVSSFVSGDYEQVKEALYAGSLHRKRHRMPGCKRQLSCQQRLKKKT